MSEGHTEHLDSALDGRYRIERELGEGGIGGQAVVVTNALARNR